MTGGVRKNFFFAEVFFLTYYGVYVYCADRKGELAMPFEKNTNTYKRQIEARMKKLAGIGTIIDGSLVVAHRRCGNPNCRCARGEPHPGHYLTRKVNNKTESLYIPVGLVEDVKQWVSNRKKLKRLVAEICELQRCVVKNYVGDKKREKGRKRSAE